MADCLWRRGVRFYLDLSCPISVGILSNSAADPAFLLGGGGGFTQFGAGQTGPPPGVDGDPKEVGRRVPYQTKKTLKPPILIIFDLFWSFGR